MLSVPYLLLLIDINYNFGFKIITYKQSRSSLIGILQYDIILRSNFEKVQNNINAIMNIHKGQK